MSSSDGKVLDFAALRRSCTHCSLHELCLPAGIDVLDMSRLEQFIRKRRPLARGDVLYRPGTAMQSLFVARDGSFKSTALGEDGSAQVVGFHLPGELIGLDGLGEGRFRCETTALEPATICEIPYADLGRIAAELPSLQSQLMRVIGRSVERDQEHLGLLGRRHATDRILLFLHGLSERRRRLGLPHRQFSLPMSRDEIASYLGLVIETVSRTLTRLQEDGLIDVRGRQLSILDEERLAGMVHEG
jgi:CRP/FNR family transcriptional regulator, anaerobic regulatory protein